jgi:hypothetical protein
MLAQHRFESTGVTEGELPQQCSHCRGCVHATEHGLHAARAQHVEVIDAVRALRIPATSVLSFGAGFADPDLIRGALMRTLSASRPRSPVCSANVITGTNPLHDTRLPSSSTADSEANLYETCTGSAFPNWTRLLRENTNHPSSEGTCPIPIPTSTKSVGGFRLKPATQHAQSPVRAVRRGHRGRLDGALRPAVRHPRQLRGLRLPRVRQRAGLAHPLGRRVEAAVQRPLQLRRRAEHPIRGWTDGSFVPWPTALGSGWTWECPSA